MQFIKQNIGGSHQSQSKEVSMSTKRSIITTAIVAIIAVIILVSCEKSKQATESTQSSDIPEYQFEATGEDYLISALDELESIADMNGVSGISKRTLVLSNESQKSSLAKTSVDTIYIYGALTEDGYGATITERYTHPKGIPLITVRKSYGKGNGHTVTETKRYVSHADFLANNPQQSNITEVFGLSSDTIVTHVLRNGTLETYTFRLPVITRTTNPQDGSVKVSTRYAKDQMVVTEVRDGNGVLSQLRKTFGRSDGGIFTRTEYADSSWRQVGTLGNADGTITRFITTSK